MPHDDADAHLAVRAAEGDLASFESLYRQHAPAAWRVAMAVTGNPHDAADAVSDAFIRVLQSLPNGLRDGAAFRPYLLAATRNASVDGLRRGGRLRPTASTEQLERPAARAEPADDLEATLESSLVAVAFRSLPERWRSVLWLTEVEGIPPREVAGLLGVSPNGVSQLAVRARAGLRQRFLQAHLGAGRVEEGCRFAVDRLGAYVAGGLSPRDVAKVDQHLAGCGTCRGRVDHLHEVGWALRRSVLPAPAAVLAWTLGRWRRTAAGNAGAPAGAGAGSGLAAGAGAAPAGAGSGLAVGNAGAGAAAGNAGAAGLGVAVAGAAPASLAAASVASVALFVAGVVGAGVVRPVAAPPPPSRGGAAPAPAVVLSATAAGPGLDATLIEPAVGREGDGRARRLARAPSLRWSPPDPVAAGSAGPAPGPPPGGVDLRLDVGPVDLSLALGSAGAGACSGVGVLSFTLGCDPAPPPGGSPAAPVAAGTAAPGAAPPATATPAAARRAPASPGTVSSASAAPATRGRAVPAHVAAVPTATTSPAPAGDEERGEGRASGAGARNRTPG